MGPYQNLVAGVLKIGLAYCFRKQTSLSWMMYANAMPQSGFCSKVDFQNMWNDPKSHETEEKLENITRKTG